METVHDMPEHISTNKRKKRSNVTASEGCIQAALIINAPLIITTHGRFDGSDSEMRVAMTIG
jgi:hypothetical protein